jgi:small conductance mechanosensitive channel
MRPMDRIVELLTEKGAVFGARILALGVAFAASFLIASWARRAVLRGLSRTKADATLSQFLANFLRYAIIVATLIACLGAVGFQTASFAALLGAAGLAIGLAFQGTLSNFAAGIMLILFRPFKVGDTIRVSNQIGTVRELELFTTELVTVDNRKIILPNAQVFGQTLENVTHYPTRRVDIALQVPLRINSDATEQALLEAARGVPGVIDEPPAEAALVELGVMAVWQLRVWCNTPDFARVQVGAARAAKRALDQLRSLP